MKPSIISLELPAHLDAFVKEEADDADLSVQAWLLRELQLYYMQRQQTSAFFVEHAQAGKAEAWEEIMAQVPNVPPMPGDELHEHSR